jgi:hypothetical protein
MDMEEVALQHPGAQPLLASHTLAGIEVLLARHGRFMIAQLKAMDSLTELNSKALQGQDACSTL